jgi:hypothetical protein
MNSEKSGDADQVVLLMISLGASIPISLLCERLWKKIEEREDAVVMLLPPPESADRIGVSHK